MWAGGLPPVPFVNRCHVHVIFGDYPVDARRSRPAIPPSLNNHIAIEWFCFHGLRSRMIPPGAQMPARFQFPLFFERLAMQIFTRVLRTPRFFSLPKQAVIRQAANAERLTARREQSDLNRSVQRILATSVIYFALDADAESDVPDPMRVNARH